MVGVRQNELREAATAAQDAPGRDLPGEDQGVGAYDDVDGVAVPLLDGVDPVGADCGGQRAVDAGRGPPRRG